MEQVAENAVRTKPVMHWALVAGDSTTKPIKNIVPEQKLRKLAGHEYYSSLGSYMRSSIIRKITSKMFSVPSSSSGLDEYDPSFESELVKAARIAYAKTRVEQNITSVMLKIVQ